MIDDIRITKGSHLGTLKESIYGDISDSLFYLTACENEIFFIADSAIDIDDPEIQIEATVIKDMIIIGKMAEENSQNQNIDKGEIKTNFLAKTTSADEGTNFDFPKIKAKLQLFAGTSNQILLGMSKYYMPYLHINEESNLPDSVIILESICEYGEEPHPRILCDDNWFPIYENCWGENPIEILGEKSGIYWENKWFDKSDNNNKPLPLGMIRLIGRYWEEGKNFKVNLQINHNGLSNKIELNVIKPSMLLSKGQLPTYSRAKDINDEEINIDKLCIKYGGKFGVPPQMLKG
ncbi:MAG: hypothetical protein JEY94_16565 [Melioribacteraceae bacterium]|nr:hypothetical protein [Melioribacteraceae bacterium]